MSFLDVFIIVAYLAASAIIGLKLSGKQADLKGYFLGGRDMPWWAVCLSVVATETSALTVISVPTVAYTDSMTYLSVAIGYLIGRTVVALVLLPRYFKDGLSTPYAFLGKRFGRGMQTTSSVAFLFTRLLADGVRLFAAAIPIKVILDGFGLNLSFFAIIAILGVVTIIYTFIGGLRAVVWVDVFQMMLYIVGGIVTLVFVINAVGGGFLADAAAEGKTQILDFSSNPISEPYAFLAAVVGGAVMGTASHGADHIVVQRLLACRNLKDAQIAVIGSAVVVGVQFALFLVVGLGLWAYYQGASPEELGLASGDEIFPTFIVNVLPAGLSGLLLAAIMASAMSTISSSLSALSSSTMTDVFQKFTRRELDDRQELWYGRLFTVGWGLVFIIAAAFFTGTDNPVVELGLSVAGLTYGGLLGSFLLGLFVPKARQLDAIVGFVLAVATMSYLFLFQPELVGFTWYTAIGVVITMGVGGLLSLRHRDVAPGFLAEQADDEEVDAV